MTNKPEQLPEWRKALNEAVENYQSTRAWYEENQDSPSAEQDMDAAAGEIEKLIKQYGVLIVLNLLDEIDELQERRKADSEKIAIAITTEQRRVIEMLLAVCSAAFELADDSCQQDVDGEECHVVPDDSFKTLARALDEIENTLPTEDADRPDVFLAWAAMPRAVLKSLLHAPQPALVVPDEKPMPEASKMYAIDAVAAIAEVRGWNACRDAMLQAGNSTVTPDGWQLVPKEPTQAMNKAGWDAMNEHDAINLTYRAMLAAAPQQEAKSALEIGMSRYAGAMQKLADSGD